MEEQSTNPIVLPSTKPQDYYVTRSKKVVDVILGFCIIPIIVLVDNTITSFLHSFLRVSLNTTVAISFFLRPILFIVLGVYFYKKKRRFLLIGILMSILIFMLSFGACWLIRGLMS